MKRYLTMIAVIILSIAFIAGMATAATEAEKQAAIDAGLAYLASTQNGAGYWVSANYYGTAYTGASLLAFLEEKDNWGTNAAAYQTVVDNGLNWILSQATPYSIGLQSTGNPDSDGNGIGVKFIPGGNSTADTYVTGLALPAIAASGTPDALVTVGPLAGRTDGSGAGGAWTYQDVVQNTIDYFAYGQNPDGGWRYYANYGASDQSTTQWPVIASLYAAKMGVSAPAFVETELIKWTEYIQFLGGGTYDGAAGYTYPGQTTYGNVNETGALLIEQAFLGWGTGADRVDRALDFIDRAWLWTASSWEGNFGNPYAMWAVYKGLELMIGLDDMTTITNLHADPGDVDNPDHGWNWWEDYCEWLVNNQNASGYWVDPTGIWGSNLATPWYINILAATEIPGPQVPEPATMLLLGLGLLGVGVFRRKT